MAGMWSGDDASEIEALEDGTMPPMEPATEADVAQLAGAMRQEQAEEQDAQDEAAWEVRKKNVCEGFDEEEECAEQAVDMQHMIAS
eukprot:6173012-Prymnesium_polylepis.1